MLTIMGTVESGALSVKVKAQCKKQNPAEKPPGIETHASALHLFLQQGNQPLFGQAGTDVEGTELPEPGTDFIKPHFRNDLFEMKGIVGKEGNPPLPIVQADGTGDDLTHLSRIGTADHPVAFHHFP